MWFNIDQGCVSLYRKRSKADRTIEKKHHNKYGRKNAFAYV
jgi:hypothetical protein